MVARVTSSRRKHFRTAERTERSKGRHHAYAECNDAEYAAVKAAAKGLGLSVADFVRRCINNYLSELSEDGILLEEFKRD